MFDKPVIARSEATGQSRDCFATLAMTLLLLTLVLIPAPARAQDITTGLIGHWTLDETSGTAVVNSVPGNNGTWNGSASVQSTPGKVGSGFEFNNLAHNVEVADYPALDISGTNITVAAWVYPYDLSKSSDEALFGKAWTDGVSASPWYQYGFELDTNETDAFSFLIGSAGGVSSYHKFTNYTALENIWQHTVVTYDGSNVLFYVNGELVQSIAETDSIEARSDILRIGADFADGQEFSGRLDDIRIYNRTLTAEDVAELYNAWPGHLRYNTSFRVAEYFDGQQWIAAGEEGVPMDGLVGWWKLDETSGTLTDSSGFGNDGTAEGSPQYASSGKLSYAMGFDGTDDNINAGSDASLENLSALTYTAWIFHSSAAGGNDEIMAKSANATRHKSFFVNGTSDSIRMVIRTDGTNADSQKNGVMTPDTWHHVAATYDDDGDRIVRLYLNGAEVSGYDSQIAGTGNLQDDTGLNFRIGATGNTVPGDFFQGRIDDVRIYNRALSAEEVSNLYELGNSQFKYLTPLNNPSPNSLDELGYSIALSGTTAVVGAYRDESDGAAGVFGAGRAYVFDTTTGNIISTLNNPTPHTADEFGNSVAISGSVVVVGVAEDEANGTTGTTDAGRAYVFDAATGNLTATLNNPTPNTDDNFGESVAVSGTTAVVGAHLDESNGTNGTSGAGRAYVFDTTTGSLTATLNNPSPNSNDYFGWSVAISGTTAVVGASQDESDGGAGTLNAGRAYVFNTTTGNLTATLNNPNPSMSDRFGHSVAVDGTLAVVGAQEEDPSGVGNGGSAYVFDTTTGNLIATLNNPNPHFDDRFGTSVAISNTTVIVGAFRDESDGIAGVSDAGRAYVFDAMTGGLTATLNNPTPNSNDFFGNGVGISGSVAVVSARADESDGTNGVGSAGRAYVFGPGPGICVEPDRAAGTIVYNTTSDQMQFCNGEDWIAMGPAGDGGAGCANPAGTEGQLVYNSSFNALQYCEGSDWVRVGHERNAPLSNLVGHWKLDETGGSTIADSSGSGNTGTWTDGADNSVSGETASGMHGNALQFNGSSTYISIPEFPEAEGTAITLSAWIKIQSVSNESNLKDIVTKFRSGFTQWRLSRDSGTANNGQSEVCFLLNTGSSAFTCSSTEWPSDTGWHHVAAVYNGVDLRIYGDGVLIGTPTAQTGSIFSGFNHNICIGNEDNGSGCIASFSHWNGSLDDVRIYSRALSASEIADLYLATGGSY